MANRVAQVLVVDDELAMREICRRSLESAGHEVTLAESGPDALEVFSPGAFDLVLTDLMMPGMSGLDLLERLLAADPNLACVMITGSATIETAVEAIKLGAYNYVSKPFTPKELVALAEKALQVRWLKEEAERNLLLLSAEQSRLRTIVQSMEDGVLVTNREGKLVYYNPALLRLLQIRDQRPEVGAPPSSAMFPADLLSSMDEALAQDETIRVARELSGGPPHLSASVAVIRDERADSIGTVAVLRDVTEAKKLEQQMGAFVSMVAHELRAPLGVIARYLDLVLEGVITDNPAKLEQVLGRCRNRTGALAQLVKDLLEFSRLRHEKTRDRTFTPVDLAEIMRETVDFASLSAASRKITIAADIPDDLPKVAADRDEILRLFTNLVDNGIKYNRDEGALRIGTSLRGGYVCMEVVDTGLGIPKDHLNRLGEAFYRVKTPETASITGTGLGVSICKQIVEAHDGQLEIESEEGKGSTFRVLLPAMGATA